MTSNLIDRLIAGTCPDPDGGPNLDVRVRGVAIEPSLDGMEAELIARLDIGDQMAVVSDRATHAVLGERIERALAGQFSITSVGLGDRPEPDERAVARLLTALPTGTDALIGVGTGTVNDVCKAVAAKLGRPYVIFPTAPSVNGYASITASITTTDGFKQSIPAEPPVGVFADLGVLAGAPRRLILSGLGESLNRCTAQADWLLAHLVLDQPYRSAPFELLLSEEEALFASAPALVAGDLAAMERLARSLILAGMGMTISGGSVSSSQGEHLISHYIDMMRRPGEPPYYHGEQIGVTAVIMAELQERIVGSDAPPVIGPTPARRDDLIGHFGGPSGELAWREIEGKWIDRDLAEALTARAAERWDDWRARLDAVMRPAAELRAVLESAGAPVAPTDLGWPIERMREACDRAWQLRKRFTFLDLAALTGAPVLA